MLTIHVWGGAGPPHLPLHGAVALLRSVSVMWYSTGQAEMRPSPAIARAAPPARAVRSYLAVYPPPVLH